MAKARYPSETGLGDMPPVEKEMAALTFLGPEKVTADPRCPPKECVQEMLWLSYWQLSEKLLTQLTVTPRTW